MKGGEVVCSMPRFSPIKCDRCGFPCFSIFFSFFLSLSSNRKMANWPGQKYAIVCTAFFLGFLLSRLHSRLFT